MDTAALLTPSINKLFEALNVYQIETSLSPQKKHFASHIQLTDFHFNKDHLINRLKNSLAHWVFSKQRAKEIFEEEFGAEEDYSSASAALYSAAKETIRISAPQGQFGELLLNAFLQHLFKAVPLLRKQPVRTSDSHERFGADAIHYANSDGHHLYLGESKCYKSSYKFPSAFECSLKSMETTLREFNSEIRKFGTGGFIEDELRDISRKILQNKLEGLNLHPVSIIIYNETTKRTGQTPSDCIEEIKKAIITQCAKIDQDVYDAISPMALVRFTYIIIPVWDLDILLDDFVEAL